MFNIYINQRHHQILPMATNKLVMILTKSYYTVGHKNTAKYFCA